MPRSLGREISSPWVQVRNTRMGPCPRYGNAAWRHARSLRPGSGRPRNSAPGCAVKSTCGEYLEGPEYQAAVGGLHPLGKKDDRDQDVLDSPSRTAASPSLGARGYANQIWGLVDFFGGECHASQRTQGPGEIKG